MVCISQNTNESISHLDRLACTVYINAQARHRARQHKRMHALCTSGVHKACGYPAAVWLSTGQLTLLLALGADLYRRILRPVAAVRASFG